MTKTLRLSLYILLFSGLVAAQTLSPSPLASQYRTINVDVPNFTKTQVRGINSFGEVVGIYKDNDSLQHGFLLSYGVWTLLDFPGASQTMPRGINDHGTIVGMFLDFGR